VMPTREHQVDVAVIGGGLGGVAAALAALRAGCRVALTEETDWIGGQLTSQAVPPDEHPWIEQFGCTLSYRRLREAIREYLRRWYPVATERNRAAALNPGGGGVSKLCQDPGVALGVLQAYLQPYISSRQLLLFLEHTPVAVETNGDSVAAVTLRDTQSGAGV